MSYTISKISALYSRTASSLRVVFSRACKHLLGSRRFLLIAIAAICYVFLSLALVEINQMAFSNASILPDDIAGKAGDYLLVVDESTFDRMLGELGGGSGNAEKGEADTDKKADKKTEIGSLVLRDTVVSPVVYIQNDAGRAMGTSWMAVGLFAVALLLIAAAVSFVFYRRHAEKNNQRLLNEFENLKQMHLIQYQADSTNRSPAATTERSMLTAIDRHNALNNDEDFVLSINELLAEDITLASNVETLASRLNMTTQTFRRHLKSATGQLPKNYLSSIRMKHACDLLVNTNISLVEIARVCGFTDASNFTRSFRADFGMTPSAYRTKYRRHGKHQATAEHGQAEDNEH